MPGHYVRVQEAASLLGVTPPTIRWYCAQGFLPTFWIGRGQTGHRRFLYANVAELAGKLGRSVPPEKDWDQVSPWTVKALSEYLGLSGKFLIDTGLVATGAVLSWDELQAVERAIYGDIADQSEEAGDDRMVNEARSNEDVHERHEQCMRGESGHHHQAAGHWRAFAAVHGHHRRERFAHRPGMGHAPGVPGHGLWAPEHAPFAEVDPTDLLALKSAKRHLEARKADLEDQIADLASKIEAHPDYEG